MDIKDKKIAVIGGDQRSVHLANLMSISNEVCVYALDSKELNPKIQKTETLEAALDCAHIVIGPVPMCKQSNIITTPLFDGEVLLSDLIGKIPSKSLFIGCKLDQYVSDFTFNGVYYVDIIERDDFAIPNAISTAEGAIQIAMTHTEFTLSNNPCLILGYGRCAKILAKKLQGIGAKVSIAARKKKDLEYISVYGYEAIDFKHLNEMIENYPLIINTVPAKVLNHHLLQEIDYSTVIIDLASKPGGVDFEYCDAMGIMAIHSLGLPGKVAPKTAAEVIYRCINNVLIERRE